MIYCVEDDNSIRELVLYALRMAGFEACGFGESESFWTALRDKLPELILLDIMLPGEDGITILKKLRSAQETASVPVIMVTAKASEYDRVFGLDLGADDYLCKPFGMMEMVSRIRAVLRRSAPPENRGVLHCGDIGLDTQRHTVTVKDRSVPLTFKEYELLKLLMESNGRVFTREELLTAIWGTDFMGESRTVDVHVGTLRTKLGTAGSLIRTVRGVGYKMETDSE